jgi:nitric oxide reductase NorD protein
MTDGEGTVNELFRRARIPELIAPSTWRSVSKIFVGPEFDQWVDGLQALITAGVDPAGILNFARGSTESAKHVGTSATCAAVPVAVGIIEAAGPRAGAAFLGAIADAAHRLKDAGGFRRWAATIEELSRLAPESVEIVLGRTGFLLSRLDAAAFHAWALAGVREAAGDHTRRMQFFALGDATALRAFEQAASDVLFADVERRLKAFIMALWGLRPAIRTAAIRPGAPAPRRSSFDGLFIRIPETYAGFRGDDAILHYRAALAHVGAHLVHTRQKFDVGTLKPVQIALVSLIEDARVETLAAREYPGLRRLWARYHVAKPQSALVAELLMARLSRSLIDPDYRDDDPWVNKGRMMFFDHRSAWDDPLISRKIGGLLGNDLGQMRIQFNPKTYVVEPSYRDDNNGIWDFGDPPPEEAETAETVIDSVRIERREEKDNPEQREREEPDRDAANRASKMHEVAGDVGIPIGRYPEWDHVGGRERSEWTTVMEFPVTPAPADTIRSIEEEYDDVARRIEKLVRAAKISRPMRLRRQPQGDRLDLDSSIRAIIDHRSGSQFDARVYETRTMRARDLSVLVLLDVSESTRDRIRDTTTTVLSVERAATALLSGAMAGLGDTFAIHAFCSNGREEVRYYRVKDFGEPYTDRVRSRLAGVRGQLSTRLGAALRHAGTEVSRQQTHRRLVLVVSDGEPSDIDVADKKYLVEDARKAVHDLSHKGIDVYCVGLDSGGESYLQRIFGRRNFVMINRVEALPEKLPMLYLRLTI